MNDEVIQLMLRVEKRQFCLLIRLEEYLYSLMLSKI